MDETKIHQDELEWEIVDLGGDLAHRRKPLAAATASRRLGLSLYEVAPGRRAWPRHAHLANEEAVWVLAGRGRVRVGACSAPVAAGDYISFPVGPQYAHDLMAVGDEPLRYLCASTQREPDIGYYPDSHKIGVFAGSAPGGGDRSARTFHGFFDVSSPLSYAFGEVAGATREGVSTIAAPSSEPVRICRPAELRAWDVHHGERFAFTGRSMTRHVGATLLGCMHSMLRPGKTSFPRHAHLANEEGMYILEGSGRVRVGDREHEVRAGDWVAYPVGREHAHTTINTGNENLIYLCWSTQVTPEVAHYPDSDKVGVLSASERTLYDARSQLEYWEREDGGGESA